MMVWEEPHRALRECCADWADAPFRADWLSCVSRAADMHAGGGLDRTETPPHL